ncbi:MAG TPA: radical SAM protein [Kiritimatiellia bacterium]|nr:radical SAM protein [Kiritimatiellia bacterium]
MTEFCPESSVSEDFLRRLNRQAALARVPVAGSLELTSRCNFQCVHCYLQHDEKDMPLSRIRSLLDQIAGAGCLFLLLTGGEPLLRADFPEIYEYAARKGLLLTVFTNGSLIEDATVELFRRIPPQAVDITLYGASAETYRVVTGRGEGFEEVRSGIEKLRAAGVRVKLKAVMLRQNEQDLPAIEKLARDFGTSFRMDPVIFSRLNGDRDPLTFRVDPEKAVQLEFSSPRRAADWKKHFERASGVTPSGRLYSCGAGVTSFHIDSTGKLQPCIMTPYIQYDLNSGSFAAGWRRISEAVTARDIPENWVCGSCRFRPLCGICPGYAWFETGAEDKPADYLCKLGQTRYMYLLEGAEDANRKKESEKTVSEA